MEYKVLIPRDQEYPKRLLERLRNDPPEQIFYWGPLDFLNRSTLAVISADSISGLAMVAANQLLFTIREYDLNLIGGWHSVMETEIFRLGLFRKNLTVTLFTAKGLAHETFDSFLETRFYPPLHEFPEREEYFRRAKEERLLMLSISPPEEKRMKRPTIITRNWLACVLSDVVFIPFAEKGTKTLALAKRVLSAQIPIFTSDHEDNKALHQLGIPGLSRKSVGNYLESLGAHRASSIKEDQNQIVLHESNLEPEDKSPRFIQGKLNF
jgi:predicted Rossmann fold nucleotide-binding protein DprA/Smf involved in DNA uptake